MKEQTEPRNKPLTRADMDKLKELPVRRDEKGRPIPVYEHSLPNRQQRDYGKKALHNNSKWNKSRHKQRAEVTYRKPILDKEGKPTEKYEVVRTGYFKTISHKLVPAKINRAVTNLLNRRDERAKRIKDAGELSEHAKDNS